MSVRPRLRAALLATLLAVTGSAIVAAPSHAAVEILSRGFAPDPAVEGGQATLTVDVTVGQAPYIVEFFCCDATNIDTPAQTKVLQETSPETQGLRGTHAFTFDVGAAGTPNRTVTVRVTDSTGAQQRQALTFQPPTRATPPVPVTPPEPAGPTRVENCPKTVEFTLVRLRTTGGSCWQEMRAGTDALTLGGVALEPRQRFFQTADRFVLNGIPFPAAPDGTTYVLGAPTQRAPGGTLGIDRSIEVKLGPVTVLRGQLLWKLPSGTSEGALPAITLPAGRLGGLPIGGQVQAIFRKRAGRFTTSFPISVTLPSIFRPSPGTTGAITGQTEISTDDARGVSVDGGRIEVANAAIGKVALKNLCFSYLSANVSRSFAACEPPSLNGAPAVQCTPPSQRQERFDGSVLIGLPTPSRADFAAYGGIAGGQFAYAGGFVDNARIPLVQGITLERVGFGLCLRPDVVVRGDAGLGFANGLVRGDVSVTYAEQGRTFFVEAAGFLRVADIPVGNGRVRVNSNGVVDFDVNASVLLAGGFVQINGGVSGFVQPRPFLFNLDGRVALCLNLGIFGSPCVAQASATVSSLGIGGCGEFRFIGAFSGFFFYQTPRNGKRFDFGAGCGFQSRVRIARPRQIGPQELTFPVPPDNDQYVLHVQGVGKPPKILVSSPTGRTFQSGPDAQTTDNATFLIVENPEAPETSVFFSKDAVAGGWKVRALEGSQLAGAEFQAEEKRPTVVAGTIRATRDGQRELDLRYRLREGDTVTLDVIGKDFQQPIASGLRGRPCTGGRRAPGSTTAESRCRTLRFRPAFGYEGRRIVRAIVLDAQGAEQDRFDVTSYMAPAPATPRRTPALRLVRRGSDVFAVWGRTGGNTTRYAAYATLGDGRRLGHTAPADCLAWRIGRVRRDVPVTLRIQSGRQDIRFGRTASVTLRAGASYAGPRALRSARLPRACASI
ncbi:hypothetical protein GKE82_17780 [Conexibacter sp. W3-3-2]|uniref:hypothetical protein n=1 Tax=Conexibacter sp. W3-3-2 TaxID=2675227 RepID=UPI0012B73C7D|nr:hypothetical protein [Conexibacter sp. W3-3-2]MTD46084.1 hypothetical protein [Conexibacter sp. W3-3-2]